VVSLALCATLAACGSSGSSGSGPSSPATTGAGATPGSANSAKLVQARVAAAKCLRAQGIDVPDPSTQKGSALRTLTVIASYPTVKVNAAAQACSSEVSKAYPNVASLSSSEKTRRLQELQAFATCMRSHGIPYPDPSSYASDPDGLLKAFAAVDQNSPAYKAAAPGCMKQALKDAGG
jgi:hypothetical protein